MAGVSSPSFVPGGGSRAQGQTLGGRCYAGDSNIWLSVGRRRSQLPSVLSPGVVRQVRPIVGPFHAVLKLEMNYVVGGVVSHRNVVNVHIFVSEYWF